MPAYVALGSNLGDKEGYLRTAIENIARTERIQQASSIYETDPIGYLDQPTFLNMVIEVGTAEDPQGLLRMLRSIELSLRRERTFTNAPRTIDLDILLFDDVVMHSADLTIPHPRMHERPFVLIPLAEIASDVVVPTYRQTVQELLDALPDTSGVVYWGEY
jgi:2-amino-4-hydroxy-6-hydroxymethyldihydropteridine diphosphokinase